MLQFRRTLPRLRIQRRLPSRPHHNRPNALPLHGMGPRRQTLGIRHDGPQSQMRIRGGRVRGEFGHEQEVAERAL